MCPQRSHVRATSSTQKREVITAMARNPALGNRVLWSVLAQIAGHPATGTVFSRGGNDYVIYFPGHGEHLFDFRGPITEEIVLQKIERRYGATNVQLTKADAEAPTTSR